MSLSEYWAWVRYLHAISPDPDLRLTSGFANLDSHQKTILSDDFGMGVPMFWLSQHLNLGPTADGKYFIDRVTSLLPGATTKKTSKRGPNKSPDFVARDPAGIWHVIECKGTQSGIAYLRKQIGGGGPPSTGAVSQKTTITFPPGYSGQRLACGLSLGFEGGPHYTSLLIRDPPPEDPFVLPETNLDAGYDAIIRSNAARGLRMAGFVDSASALAAPSGLAVAARRTSGRAEERRQTVVEQKRRRAELELSQRTQVPVIQTGGEDYQGRHVTFALPRPLDVEGRLIKAVRVEQGVNTKVLSEIERQPLVEGEIQSGDTAWRETIGAIKVEGGDFEARLTMGTYFSSHIELVE